MLVHGQQVGHRLPALHVLDHIGGPSRLDHGLPQQVGQRPVGVHGLRTALHEHGVAGAQRQRADLDHRVGPALEDDQQDSDRNPYLLEDQPVVQLPADERSPHGIGRVDQHLHTFPQRLQLGGRQCQALADRSREIIRPRRRQIPLVGGKQVVLTLAEQALQIPQHLCPRLSAFSHIGALGLASRSRLIP